MYGIDREEAVEAFRRPSSLFTALNSSLDARKGHLILV